MWFSNPHKTPIGSCVAGLVEELGGKPGDYNQYCECFLSRTKELLSEKEYKEWARLYTSDRELAKKKSLERKELLNSQFGCFVEHATLHMWAEAFVKIYTEVEKLPSEAAYCIVEEFAKHIDDKDIFIIFAQMKMQLLEQSDSFKEAEELVKEDCIESLSSKNEE